MGKIRSERIGIRIPIRIKITLPFVLAALALAIGATYVVSRLVFENVDARYLNQLLESGRFASAEMVAQENKMLQALRLTSQTIGLPELVEARDLDRLRELTLSLAAGQNIEAIEYLDSQANLVLALRQLEGGNQVSYTSVTGGDANYRQWDFARKVFDRISDDSGDKYSGVARASWGNYFYVAGPLYANNGAFVGVLLVGQRLETLAHNLRLASGAQITFYDAAGQAMVSTFSTSQPVETPIIQAALDNKAASSYRRPLSNFGLDYDEIISAWEARNRNNLGALGVALFKNYLVNAAPITRLQITVLVAAAMVLVMLIGLLVAGIITQPIAQLVNASEEVGRGNLQIKVNIKTDDEVEILAKSFNDMVGNLNQSKEDLLNAYDATLEGWAQALELRDKETAGHTARVTKLTVDLAQAVGVQGEALTNLRRGALLHDIGKMGVPDAILLKPGPLTEAEWQIMRQHPEFAVKMLKNIGFLHSALDIPYCHHERWDGTGYPRQLSGEAIPLAARVFSIVDVWDAITSERPYRRAMSLDDARQEIKKSSGTYFDPQLVEVFLSLIQGKGVGDGSAPPA